MGDHCDSFEQNIINSKEYQNKFADARKRGAKIIVKNQKQHAGHSGEIINHARQHATGKYFIFYDNDDVILPNHFENYINAIEKEQADMACISCKIETPFRQEVRQVKPPLCCGAVGHSEIIVTNLIQKKVPLHVPDYGHDWIFIQNILKSTCKIFFSENKPSYIVRHIPGQGSYDEWV